MHFQNRQENQLMLLPVFFVIKEKSKDKSIGIINFYESEPVNGRIWTQLKIEGKWLPWSQS
ncbi:Uncharacterised protein [Escherichia coli]|nr:Uncharacterised protein [Escherichia coli]